jgi:hypothetical protein
MRHRSALFAIGLAALTGTAAAGPYATGGLSFSATRYKNIQPGLGYAAGAGYVFEGGRVPVFVDASVQDSGWLDVEGEGVRLRYDGFHAYGGVMLPERLGLRGWGKLGVAALDQRFDSGAGTRRERKVTPSIGLGADWMALGPVGLRVEAELPLSVRTFNDRGDGKSPLAVLKLGLVWRPAWPRAAAPLTEPAPAAVPEVAPTVAVTGAVTPVAEAATAPQTTWAPPPPPPPPAKPTATLPAGIGLRAQARPDSRALVTTTAASTVIRDGGTVNDSGSWVYVKGPEGQGWVLESELAR